MKTEKQILAAYNRDIKEIKPGERAAAYHAMQRETSVEQMAEYEQSKKRRKARWAKEIRAAKKLKKIQPWILVPTY